MRDLQSGDPSRVGPYELLGRLGHGGTGQVYLGAAVGGGLVAVKVIHPERARDPRFREQLRQAVVAGQRLGPPTVVAVLAADLVGDRPWVATAFVPGPPLKVAAVMCGLWPTDVVHRLAATLAAALVDIHAAGLEHGAITPSNVLLGPDRPYLIDLGVADLAGPTPFRALEQAESGSTSPAADVFSMGRVIAYAACGRAVGVPGLRDVAPPLNEILRACLVRNPADRPTAAQLAATLLPGPPIPETGWSTPAIVALDPSPG